MMELTRLEKLFLCLVILTISMAVIVNNYRDNFPATYLRQEGDSRHRVAHYFLDEIYYSEYLEKSNVDDSSDTPTSNISKSLNTSIAEIELLKPLTNLSGEQMLLTSKLPTHQLKQSAREDSVEKKYNTVIDHQISYKQWEEKKPSKIIVNRKEHNQLNESKNSTCLPVLNRRVPKVDLHECLEPHVIMHDGGQMGNKMCQYVSLYLLRHLFGIRVSITSRMKSTLGFFFKDISLPVQDFTCYTRWTKRIMYDDLYNMIYSKALESFDKPQNTSVHSLIKESYYIFHHPCPRDLISMNRHLIQRVLSFRSWVIHKAKININEALESIGRKWENSTLITVHVRRKDYTRYILKHYNLTQLDETYFNRAFDYFRIREKNPVFVVVSDDHSWCRDTLEEEDVVVAGSKKDPTIDMAVLSLGNHHIISYGTFSFMGAILGHGTILHPVSDNSVYDHYDCVDKKIFKPIQRDADAK